MNTSGTKDRFLAAHKLLVDETTSLEKFESVKALLKGLNPKIDKTLDVCSKALSNIENLGKGDIISISTDNLPEETEEEKRKKKALILFIKTWKTLQSEIERIGKDLEADKDNQKGIKDQVSALGKILVIAKGPFGAITILAIIIAGFLIFRSGKTRDERQSSTLASSPTPVLVNTPTPAVSPTPNARAKIKVISFSDKKIPLSELEVKTGPDCTNSPSEAPHYHAKNGRSVKAIDGTQITDPGACAFGKVSEVAVEEIETP